MSVAAYFGDTDSEDELPLGWEERIHSDGRIYYANHETQSTQWTHPKSGIKKSVPKELPFGWKKDRDEKGKVIFEHDSTGKKTYTDPRLAFSRDTKQSLYDFKQRFDASSTALQVLNGVDLSSKKAIVTGSNSGIGLEIAKCLAKHGCEVILACRDIKKAKSAERSIKQLKPTANLEIIELNLESLISVKNFANEILLKYNSLDFVFCNAAIFGAPYALTVDNYERTFQVNYLSHFYLILCLKPLLKSTPGSRILNITSESHRFSLLTADNINEEYLSPVTAKSFVAFMAYNDSKLCNAIISNEISRRWTCEGIFSNSIHPGNMVSTGLSRYWWIYRVLFAIVRPFTKSLQQAAATGIWAATASELNGVSGHYFNNSWLGVPSPKVYDEALGVKLWDVSVSMIEKAVGHSVF